jgi:hypothetical protein
VHDTVVGVSWTTYGRCDACALHYATQALTLTSIVAIEGSSETPLVTGQCTEFEKFDLEKVAWHGGLALRILAADGPRQIVDL